MGAALRRIPDTARRERNLCVATNRGVGPFAEQVVTSAGVGQGPAGVGHEGLQIDLAANEEQAESGVREKLRGTAFADAPIVRTSTVTDRGIPELKAALANVLAQTPVPRDISKPRLAVDRVFTLHGIGTVVTGTLSGGTLKVGQSVVIQPSGKATRVRNLQSHNQDVPSVGPGTRTAINLPDVFVAGKGQGYAGSGISRGEVVTLPELGEPSTTMDVTLQRTLRTVHMGLTESRPLKDEITVRVHHGSASHAARGP